MSKEERERRLKKINKRAVHALQNFIDGYDVRDSIKCTPSLLEVYWEWIDRRLWCMTMDCEMTITFDVANDCFPLPKYHRVRRGNVVVKVLRKMWWHREAESASEVLEELMMHLCGKLCRDNGSGRYVVHAGDRFITVCRRIGH